MQPPQNAILDSMRWVAYCRVVNYIHVYNTSVTTSPPPQLQHSGMSPVGMQRFLSGVNRKSTIISPPNRIQSEKESEGGGEEEGDN